MRKSHTILAVAVLILCQLSTQASFVPAFLPPSGAPTVNNWGLNNPVNLGMKFTPQANITVDALAFYKGANTLTAGESVGIFNPSGGLVTSTFVSLSDTLQDGYLWHAISSVVLNAGQQYTVVAYTGANPWSYGGVPMVNSSISYGGQTYHYGGGLTFPTQTVGHAADGYYGPNFSIAAVPEPSTVIAGALLLLPCGLALRQFLKKANAA